MESGLQHSWGTAALAGWGFSALPKVVQGCSERQDKNPVLFTMVARILASQFLAIFVH